MNGLERFKAELKHIQEYCQSASDLFQDDGVFAAKIQKVCGDVRLMVGNLFCIFEELKESLQQGGDIYSEKKNSDSMPLFDYIRNFRRNNVYYDLLIFEDAVKELKRVLDESTDSHVIAAAYNGLGHIYAIRKMYSQAIYYFKKVVEFYPGNSDGYFNLGAAYFNLGLYEEAKYYFYQAIYYHPDDWEAYFYLGRTYEKLEDREKALYYIQLARMKKYSCIENPALSG